MIFLGLTGNDIKTTFLFKTGMNSDYLKEKYHGLYVCVTKKLKAERN
jgi:hypothetical protein